MLALDRAVEARYAGTADKAAGLVREARRLDPEVPGASFLIAEMLLRQGDTENAGVAAREALAHGEHAADARLILALKAWMLRGQMGAESAGATTMQMLAEASEQELSNGAVRFFTGDLQRAIGRPSEAHRSLLCALYRQQPWDSSALLAAKLALAIDESGPRGDSVAMLAADEQAEFFGLAASDLMRASRGSVSRSHDARAFFSSKQLAWLALDASLASVSGLSAGKSAGFFLPFAEVDRPSVAPKGSYQTP